MLMTLASCVTQRQVEYIQDSDKNIKGFMESDFPDYILKPNDELFIQVFSLDEGRANVFNNATGSTTDGTTSPYGASLLSYPIDKDGFIQLPIVGNVMISGKTLFEVSSMLMDSLSNVLSSQL